MAVLNRDDGAFEFLDDFTKTAKKSYGIRGDADVRAEEVSISHAGIRFLAASNDFRVDVTSVLTGRYNISNCLAALTAAVYGLGIPPEAAAKGIACCKGRARADGAH